MFSGRHTDNKCATTATAAQQAGPLQRAPQHPLQPTPLSPTPGKGHHLLVLLLGLLSWHDSLFNLVQVCSSHPHAPRTLAHSQEGVHMHMLKLFSAAPNTHRRWQVRFNVRELRYPLVMYLGLTLVRF